MSLSEAAEVNLDLTQTGSRINPDVNAITGSDQQDLAIAEQAADEARIAFLRKRLEELDRQLSHVSEKENILLRRQASGHDGLAGVVQELKQEVLQLQSALPRAKRSRTGYQLIRQSHDLNQT
ncbi:MAG: hypothetical protein FRX49_08982 [Trebouxia sp. A1-2]|nr:MAG: hypothetical protein FRX49_08982 [Trebouxia sp. A1-2]